MSDETTELRKKLAERGIAYRTSEVHGMPETIYESDGLVWNVTEHVNGSFVLLCAGVISEQAIAATLGSGTCEMETDWDYLDGGITGAPEDTWAYMCSACGWSFRYDRGIKPDYCPSCGRKVKND